MNLENIAANSLVNCHVKGLDSIVLDTTPGKHLRAFVATATHELWRNAIPITEKLSVAVHPHHCDITLVPAFGRVYNVVQDVRGEGTRLRKFYYKSQIKNGAGSFEDADEYRFLHLKPLKLQKGWPMPAAQLHSIYVPKGETAAWFVYEHAEDKAYQPVCFSNDDLQLMDFSELYQPMSIKRAEEILPLIGRTSS